MGRGFVNSASDLVPASVPRPVAKGGVAVAGVMIAFWLMQKVLSTLLTVALLGGAAWLYFRCGLPGRAPRRLLQAPGVPHKAVAAAGRGVLVGCDALAVAAGWRRALMGPSCGLSSLRIRYCPGLRAAATAATGVAAVAAAAAAASGVAPILPTPCLRRAASWTSENRFGAVLSSRPALLAWRCMQLAAVCCGA